MANKIKLARGTKSRIETVKSNLDNYEIVYATDTNELGVKNSSDEIEYFYNKTQLENNIVQLYGGKNLAAPDLKGKEYLGGGDYKLNSTPNVSLLYNVYSGVFTYNQGTFISGNIDFDFIIPSNENMVLSYIYLSGSKNGALGVNYGGKQKLLDNTNFTDNFVSTNTVRLWLQLGANTNNFQFKLQIEKGSTATPYTLPMVITPEYIKQTQTPRLIYSNSGNSSGTDITFSYVDNTMKVGDVYKVHSLLTYDNSELTQREVNDLIISDTVNNNIEKNHYAKTQHSAITKVNYDYTTKTFTMIGDFNTGDSSNSFNIRLYKVGY